MRILVTGNLGYIGSVLTPLLSSAGYEVWGLDAGYFNNCIFGSIDKQNSGVIKQWWVDIRNVSKEHLHGVQTIIHLAALSNDPLGELNPGLTKEINHIASVRLAQIAKSCGIKRFIFSSSCSIYGQTNGHPLDETAPIKPLTAYAKSKIDTETDISRLASDEFSPIFLRSATAYGLSPRIRFDLVVNNLAGWAFTTKQIKLLSDGKAWRPLVHVEDISRAFIAALTATRSQVHNQVINVGSDDQNYQVYKIADLVAKSLPGCQIIYAEGAAADRRSYIINFKKIGLILTDFHLKWDVSTGIQQLFEAFKALDLKLDTFKSSQYSRLNHIEHLKENDQINAQLSWRKPKQGDE